MGSSFWKAGMAAKPVMPFMPAPIPLLHNTTVIEQPVDLSALVPKYVAFANGFIGKHSAAKDPWYLYVSFNHVHSPNSCAPGFCGKSRRGPIGP